MQSTLLEEIRFSIIHVIIKQQLCKVESLFVLTNGSLFVPTYNSNFGYWRNYHDAHQKHQMQRYDLLH